MTTTATPGSVTGAAITGKVHGGQQPIVGAHVYLMAANITGYGGPGIAPSTLNASLSLLTPATGRTDTLGSYVLTDAAGNFTITSDYTCLAGQQVYLYTLGGNPGSGTNASAALLAALGSCPSGGTFPASQNVFVNEVTTIAAAYAFAGFASDATHVSSSGTPLAQTGIANAFANATNLVNPQTGAALTTTPAGNGTVQTARIYTLANILASCINSDGTSSSPCPTLFSNTPSTTTTPVTPTDTATAAINIAHNPTSNVSALYTIPPPATAFGGALTAQPHDFALWVTYTGVNAPQGLAIDSTGNVWVANTGASNVVELSPSGAILSGTSGFTGGGLSSPYDVALDQTGNVWLANYGNNSVTKLNSAGAPVSGAAGYTGGGLAQPIRIAIDGSGGAWVTNYAYTSGQSTIDGTVTKFSSSGSPVFQTNGYETVGATATFAETAIDGSGSAWFAKYTSDGNFGNQLEQVNSTGTPLSAYQIPKPQNGRPKAVAIDARGNIWVANGPSNAVGSVAELSRTGTPLIGSAYGSFLESSGFANPVKIAIDGGGNAWVAAYNNYINEISPSGVILTGTLGFVLPFSPQNGGSSYGGSFAIDGSGNLWSATSASSGFVYQILGAATPVITPIAAGLPLIPTADGSSNLGTRP
jgi:hypothetical protein